MRNFAMWSLRGGLSITFIWIGLMVLQNPSGWAMAIQPWAAGLLPMSPENFMVSTGILDIAIGLMLLVNPLVGVASLLAFLHLGGVLLATGNPGIVARDIGLFGAALALTIETFPWSVADKFFHQIGKTQ